MATLRAQGTLSIDPVDFWQFVAGHLKTGNLGKPVFCVADATIQFGDDPNAVIDTGDFWAWVMDTQVGVMGAEIVFGVPRFEEDIEIDFAMDSSGNPCDWAERPACLAQWSVKRESQGARHGL